MKKKVLQLVILFLMIFCFLKSNKVNLSANVSGGYYYEQLNNRAKDFYKGFVIMEEEGLFKENKSLDLLLENIIDTNDIKQLLSGDDSLLQDFAKGKDAYYLEHPNNFYVDFSKVELSIKQQNDNYIALIDAGRNSSYLYQGIDTNNIDEMISNYNKVLTKVSIKLKDINEDILKIKFINEYICQNTSYSFCENDSVMIKNQIRTSFGALINNYSVCEGYARAFKALLDLTDIRSEIVIGYYYSGENVEPHAWNYVSLDNKWYLVDVTYNDNGNTEEYFLLGEESSSLYKEDGVISSSGFEFSYPNLATYDYGKEEIKTTVKYDRNGSYSQEITYKYKDYNNALEMQNDGLYLIIRNQYFDDEKYEVTFGSYYNFYNYSSNSIIFNNSVISTEFAITTQVPDNIYDPYGMYNSIDESKIIAKSDNIYNEIYSEESNTPKVLSINPSPTTILDADNNYEITIKYNALIKVKDENKDVLIYVYNEKSKNLNEYVKVENIKLEKDSISFDFTPSKMYEHDSLDYKFVLVNVIGNNGCAPQTASLRFARPWQVCSKIYNDERLYINAYASPTIIDARDLSMEGFLVDGKHISENERSQLTLVATKPNTTDENIMKENVSTLLDSDILSSATYNLDLHICGGVTRIPSGSYVKVAFGFPEGYGPNDAGVSFKVYHFKRDENGNIDPSLTEEVDCVVTEYGIVVTLDSFSPFMIVATNKKTNNKNIYSRVISGSGKIVSKVNDVSSNISVLSIDNGTITYEFKPSEGYQLDYCLFNKKKVEVIDNKLVLEYQEMEENNELIVSFASTEVLEKEISENIVSINSEVVSNIKIDNKKNNDFSKYIYVIGGGIILVIVLIFIFRINKNKKTKKRKNVKKKK